jgi:hypothetical protein
MVLWKIWWSLSGSTALAGLARKGRTGVLIRRHACGFEACMGEIRKYDGCGSQDLDLDVCIEFSLSRMED